MSTKKQSTKNANVTGDRCQSLPHKQASNLSRMPSKGGVLTAPPHGLAERLPPPLPIRQTLFSPFFSASDGVPVSSHQAAWLRTLTLFMIKI